jgi:hypothetical protein
MKKILQKLVFLFAIVPFFLSGCYSTAKNLQSTRDFAQARAEDSNSIVFGRIKWIESGDEKKIGKGIFAWWVKPNLIEIEKQSRIIGEIDEGGNFVWSLKKGIYLIDKIEYHDYWSGNYFINPHVAFIVPKNGKTYYLGTLVAQYERERDFFGSITGQTIFSVIDEESKDCVRYQKKFNIKSNEFEKSLMFYDPRLPKSLETKENFNMALSIINLILSGAAQ